MVLLQLDILIFLQRSSPPETQMFPLQLRERLVGLPTRWIRRERLSACHPRKPRKLAGHPSKGNESPQYDGRPAFPVGSLALWSRPSWFCRLVCRQPLAHGRGCKLFRRLRHPSEEDKVLLTSLPFYFLLIIALDAIEIFQKRELRRRFTATHD